MKRIINNFVLVLAVLLCISICTPDIITQAASRQEETVKKSSAEEGAVEPITGQTEGEKFKLKKAAGEENETLFQEYVEGTDEQGHAPRVKKSAGNKLSGLDKTIYTRLMKYISQVAAGERASTVFEINVEDLGLEQLTWTAKELGVDSIVVNQSISDEAVDALCAKGAYNLSRIIQALLADNPYGLYWYDKTASTTASGYSYSASYDYGKREYVISFTGSISFSFPAANEYAAGSYTVNTEIGQSVQTIVEKANAIVSQYASSSDYEKLNGYREEICSLVSYNDNAASGNVSYGNPWQLIWVFDDDSSTNVVCEGYSKAFQYLCNLTEFNDNIDCITVTGTMSGGTGSGPHMWNIVTMEDGQNYLVDVTNCDDGTIGQKDQLFLAAYASGSTNEGYSFICNDHGSSGFDTVSYIYDQKTLQFYESSELAIIKKEIENCLINGSDHVWDEGHVTTEAGCVKAGEKTYNCKNCKATKTEVISAIGHHYEEVVTEASCTKGGYTTHICERCKDSYVDSYTDPKGHNDLQKVEKKDSTCKEEGNIEYYRCGKCGNLFSDEEAAEEISLEETVIAKKAHTWDDGVITREPEGDVAGEKTYTCTVCGQTRTEEVTAQTIADQEKADYVIGLINSLSEIVSTDDEIFITNAREEYNALTANQKALVSNSVKQKLENAEKVLETVKIIENANAEDPASVELARQALDSLPDDLKNKVNAESLEKLEKAEADIEKNNKPVLVNGIRIAGISHNIAAGKKIQLTAAILPKNARNKKLKWTSSNTKVATVNQNGLVTVKPKTGGKSAVIKAAATDGSGKSASWVIKSMKGVVKSVKISGKKKVKAGKALKLKARVKASKGANKKLKWISGNTKYATVNGSGKVLTKAAGKGKSVRITAMATDGSGKKNTITIKIK